MIKDLFANRLYQGPTSLSERAANQLLRPVQYLWNGKKIEIILDPTERPLAHQSFRIYSPGERSLLKTALMIALFIPSIIFGGLLKLYVYYSHYSPDLRSKIPKLVKADVTSHLETEHHRGLHKFSRAIGFLSQFFEKKQIEGKRPFFAEIRSLDIESFRIPTFGTYPNARDKRDLQQTLLDNLAFLPNLEEIRVGNFPFKSRSGIPTIPEGLSALKPRVVIKAEGKEIRFNSFQEFTAHLSPL